MPLTIMIHYTGAPGQARKFAEAMTEEGIVAKIRAADGNLAYRYYVPMGDDDTVMLLDVWRDQAALDAHHASPMMARIAALREHFDLHMTVSRYRDDEDGIPASDEAFIRR